MNSLIGKPITHDVIKIPYFGIELYLPDHDDMDLRYIAMDRDGRIYAYSKIPKASSDHLCRWNSQDDEFVYLAKVNVRSIDWWEESLIFIGDYKE